MNLMYMLPEFAPDDGIYVVDTSEMFAALEGDIYERRAFRSACMLLHIPVVAPLHNAGNDAHVSCDQIQMLSCCV